MLGRILSSLEARFSQPWINWWRTVYINFRLFPFSIACKLPIYIYGTYRFHALSGTVQINAPIKRGMIKFGKMTDPFSLNEGEGFIMLGANSTLLFEGPAKFGVSSKVRIVAAIVQIGKNVHLGSCSRLIANGGKITIGEDTRFSFMATIMNSNFHYIYDYNKKGYAKMTNSVEIGSFNWIGNKTTIAPGTKTPDFSLVCSNSLLNKNYVQRDEKFPLIGGMPAKIISIGKKRVWSDSLHYKLEEYFQKNQFVDFYQTEELIDNLNETDKDF